MEIDARSNDRCDTSFCQRVWYLHGMEIVYIDAFLPYLTPSLEMHDQERSRIPQSWSNPGHVQGHRNLHVVILA